MKIKKFKQINENYDEKIELKSGVYDLTNIESLLVNYNTPREDIDLFKDNHPNGVKVVSYGVEGYYLFSEEPLRLINVENTMYPNFEGHGTLTVVNDCPRRILIIGEND